jgi:hypothetical protein
MPDFQPLVDKAVHKLSSWDDRNLVQVGRTNIVESMLSSLLVYLMTMIKPTKQVLRELDKIHIFFLLLGDKAITGWKCKVY